LSLSLSLSLFKKGLAFLSPRSHYRKKELPPDVE
uniref:Predicted gene, 17542 n=1 Tax=Mus spicilegus TaxID=10103 RepID=A0A8C6MSW7_MUSSI